MNETLNAFLPWRWKFQRVMTDRLGIVKPFSAADRKRVLFLSAPDPLCHTQLFPFFYYRRALRRNLNIEMRELPLARFERGDKTYLNQRVDAVCVQTWFDRTEQSLVELIQRVHTAFPTARIAYFDWFAPTDLRYARALDPYIDVYLKKQILTNRADYDRATLGDTNLTDFYARRYGLQAVATHFPIPDAFFDKLVLGPNFCFSAHMLPYFLGRFPDTKKIWDVHARIAVKGTEWYSRMRQEALDRVESIEGIRVLSRGFVPRKDYFKELAASRLCFSPFGYGEVCWRDYEAAFCGSLLLKPSMDHLMSVPDIFLPYQTYVPLEWDLSDLPEKVDYYLSHDAERDQITRRAFETIHDYLANDRFLTDMQGFWHRLLGGV